MQITDIGREAFKAWLVSRAFEHVGNRNDPHGCAYARFLTDKGYVHPAVGTSLFRTHQVVHEGLQTLIVAQDHRAPSWLTRFVARFDESSHEKGSGVTGAEALRYLEAA
jgi:hypothetical protein